MRRSALFLFTTYLTGVLLSQAAQAASPALSIILPRGGQRGTEVEFTFSGARLADAEEILFYSPGFTVTKLEPNGNQVKATIKIAPDCALGEHVAQVRCKSGISDYRTFYVGPFTEINEAEPNSLFEQPQPISLNVTVNGVVQNEDVDYFVVEAKQGQRISAEVEAMRLGNTLFDPYVAIMDSKRFELDAEDDTPLVIQDSVASIVAPEDGQYVIQLRESAYGGNGNCRYRLHVGTFPRPKAVYPAGGKLGEETEVTFIGDPAGDFKQKFQLPTEPQSEDFGLVPGAGNEVAPSPNPFRLYEHGNALETEPNNQFSEATPAELPLAFNGIIGAEGDIDCFKFAAKKGQVFEVECYARRIRSALDPVMNLYNAQGGGIAGNDDSRGPDSYFRFSVPADGEYILRITDHLGRGGPDFVYRVEFQPVKPSLQVSIPRVARYSQYRQTIFVPRGNRFATLLSVSRQNFGGEIVLDTKDLPQGLTMHWEKMAANMSLMPVVFEAAADAPIAGKLVDFTARHADENTGIRGGFYNRADFVISAPGQSLYRWRDVDRLAVAVVEELPFKLEIVEPKVPLVQNGAMQLKIVAHRQEGFNEQINVQFPFRPPGVGAASSVNIPAGQNEVLYPLNANGGAAVGPWKVYALGSANVNGTAWVSSQLANLEIAPMYLTFAVERAAVEQGQETEIFCKIDLKKEFEGSAKVRLLGLPHKVAAPEMELTKDMKELAFKVTTDPTSPAGNHKNIFCEVTIPESGESIVHSRVGTTELRIDKPLPKPTQPEPKPQPQQPVVENKPEPQKPPERRLTRLEMLRLEAQKRAEAAKAAGGSE